MEILDAADIWCAEILDWTKLFAREAFREIDMVQILTDGQGTEVLTTRCPVRLEFGL